MCIRWRRAVTPRREYRGIALSRKTRRGFHPLYDSSEAAFVRLSGTNGIRGDGATRITRDTYFCEKGTAAVALPPSSLPKSLPRIERGGDRECFTPRSDRTPLRVIRKCGSATRLQNEISHLFDAIYRTRSASLNENPSAL